MTTSRVNNSEKTMDRIEEEIEKLQKRLAEVEKENSGLVAGELHYITKRVDDHGRKIDDLFSKFNEINKEGSTKAMGEIKAIQVCTEQIAESVRELKADNEEFKRFMWKCTGVIAFSTVALGLMVKFL